MKNIASIEEYKSTLEAEIEVYGGSKLLNNCGYALKFHKLKNYEAIEIDGLLELPNNTQKTLTSTKPRLVSFKFYSGIEDLDDLKHKRSFRIMDYSENSFVAKGKILRE